ncbi:MAG: Spy/CpxP family protein refolding chaperone [Actinomycetota bacterium]|nr:Spy/CpxP family protein refolding chaperone [Actinomycetota bacterium]
MNPRTASMRIARIVLACVALAWTSQAAIASDEAEPGHEGKGQHQARRQTRTCAGQHCAHAGRGSSSGRHDQMGHFLERHGEALGLDDETKASIERIVGESRARSKSLEETRREAKETLRQLIESDAVDRAAVMRQVDAVGALELEQSKLRTGTILDVRAQLTPEQRALLDERRKSRKAAGRHCKHAKHGGHGKCAGETCGHGAACQCAGETCGHGAACQCAGETCGHGAPCQCSGETCGHGAACQCRGEHGDTSQQE